MKSIGFKIIFFIYLFFILSPVLADDFYYDASTMTVKKIPSKTAIQKTSINKNINAPQWSEFCPPKYLNSVPYTEVQINSIAQRKADEKTKILYCKSDKTWAKVIRGVTILPALDCWAGNTMLKNGLRTQLKNENSNLIYWERRKREFDNQLATCDGMSKDAQKICYLKVRELQLQITQADIQRMQNEYQMIQLQNINNLIRQQNYELQDINNNLYKIRNNY